MQIQAMQYAFATNKKKKVLIIETQRAETHKGLIKGNEKAHKKIFINFWPFLWMESRRAQAKIYSFCIPGLGYLLIGFLQVNMRATLHYDANFTAFFFFCFISNRGRSLCRPSKKRVNLRKFHANIIAIYQLMDINIFFCFCREQVPENGWRLDGKILMRIVEFEYWNKENKLG